jgi:hypothetical protein
MPHHEVVKQGLLQFKTFLSCLSILFFVDSFYFGDQNTADGKPAGAGEFSPESHSIAYWDLIQKKEQGNWYYRWVPPL